MASWKKYFKAVKTDNSSGNLSPLSKRHSARTEDGGSTVLNQPNLIQESYIGCTNRIERYGTYESMDTDSEINAALDILAEFSTQSDDDHLCFEIKYKDQPTDTEVKIIKERLEKWHNLNEFQKRAFRIFRNTIKYGDQIFIRDPETFKLFYVEMDNVMKVIVNESDGKKPEQYVIRNVSPNFENLTATEVNATNLYNVVPGGPGFASPSPSYNLQNTPVSGQNRFNLNQNERPIDAKNILHLSLTEGLDRNWPFGTSVLEMVYKVYKQKELLEDSVLIYRVTRAPERRVFNIDVGDMMPHLVPAYIEKIKNQMHQRKIPSYGDGNHFQDSTYFSLPPNADFFFPKNSCIALNEPIKLLDGRNLPLEEIINEYEQGKKNWVYSINPQTQKVEVGEIEWAGVTRKNAEVVRVTLDDDSSVVVTPDHPFIMRDGSEKHAGNLVTGDSLMPLYTRKIKTAKNQKEAKYWKYQDPSNHREHFTHLMVCPKSQKGRDRVVHHIDCNPENNNPTNLVEMDAKKHTELHRSLGSFHLMNAWKDEKKRANIMEGIRHYHDNATQEDNKMMKLIGFASWGEFVDSHDFIIEKKKNIAKNASIIAAKINSETRKVKLSESMADRVIHHLHSGVSSITKMSKVLRNDDTFQTLYKEMNPNIHRCKNQPIEFCPDFNDLKSLAESKGYDSWSSFKNNAKYNHKVKSVQVLDYRVDTGDITVKSESNCHNFALGIGIFVHNSGRGTTVDQLAAGSNLDQIADLLYFNKKLTRALRIPSSYLTSYYGEEGNPQMNDGRVGTALIQEHRFNEYCQRLQRLISAPLDTEFKAYLKWSGVNIDSNMFTLSFNPPQNFAHYRQAELDATKIGTFSQLEGYSYFSKRWLMKRYLGLTEDEIMENSGQWAEENPEKEAMQPEDSSLRNLDITPGGIQSDMDSFGDIEDMGEGGDLIPGEEGEQLPGEGAPVPEGNQPTPQGV